MGKVAFCLGKVGVKFLVMLKNLNIMLCVKYQVKSKISQWNVIKLANDIILNFEIFWYLYNELKIDNAKMTSRDV